MFEPRSRRISFLGDPEPQCSSWLRKRCLQRKAGAARRLPPSVSADGWQAPGEASCRGGQKVDGQRLMTQLVETQTCSTHEDSSG